MTKAELIAALSHLDDTAVILIAKPSGDYWHTTLAAPIRRLEEVQVTHSDYHDATQIVTNPDHVDDDAPVEYAYVLR